MEVCKICYNLDYYCYCIESPHEQTFTGAGNFPVG